MGDGYGMEEAEEEFEMEEGEEEGEVSEEEQEEYFEEFKKKIKGGGISTPKDFFKKVDRKPKNGKITKKEIYIYAKKMKISIKTIKIFFKSIDPDGDGEVSEEECFEILGGCKECGDKEISEEGGGDPLEDFKKKASQKDGSVEEIFAAIDKRK